MIRVRSINLLAAIPLPPSTLCLKALVLWWEYPRRIQDGPTLMSFTLYQHHQCRVPQNLILEQLRELGVDISTGQVNRILVEDKEFFHTEQSQVLQAGLETAEYVHTDDTGARHQGQSVPGGSFPPVNFARSVALWSSRAQTSLQNGFCTVIGNDLFAHNSRPQSKSRENYLRILRGSHEDFVLNEYSRSYLEMQQLAVCHLSKLEFSSAVISNGDEEWSQYLEALGISSSSGVKLPSFPQTPRSRTRNLWLAARTLCRAVFNVYCSTASGNIALTSWFYWYPQSYSSSHS